MIDFADQVADGVVTEIMQAGGKAVASYDAVECPEGVKFAAARRHGSDEPVSTVNGPIHPPRTSSHCSATPRR